MDAKGPQRSFKKLRVFFFPVPKGISHIWMGRQGHDNDVGGRGKLRSNVLGSFVTRSVTFEMIAFKKEKLKKGLILLTDLGKFHRIAQLQPCMSSTAWWRTEKLQVSKVKGYQFLKINTSDHISRLL